MKPATVIYDLGMTAYGQALSLTYSRDSGGAHVWTLYQEAASQRDESNRITGLTDRTLNAMMAAWKAEERRRTGQ